MNAARMLVLGPMLLAAMTASRTSADAPLEAVAGPTGVIVELAQGGDRLEVRCELRVPGTGWKGGARQGSAEDVKASEADGTRRWAGRMEVAKGKSCRYEQTLAVRDGRAELAATVKADSAVEAEGVYLWIDLPVSVYAGGRVTFVEDGRDRTAAIPQTLPEEYHFFSGRPATVRIEAPGFGSGIEVGVDRPVETTIQDQRKWSSETFGLYFRLSRGPLAAGTSASVKLTLRPQFHPDTTPATLAVDADKVRYRLDGFGGDFCFGTESPVTAYNLANLRVAWGRAEMLLRDWEPANDNDDPADTDFAQFAARDKPHSQLRYDFEMAAELSRRKIPFVVSIWWPPGWLCADPNKPANSHGRRIPREKWDELAESVCAYLLHAKKQYRAEADLFSFNESDAGVAVRMGPNEHRDFIKFMGPKLAAAGLKTKMLLGDTTRAGAIGFARPAADDPEAVRQCGAIAFHSWGGASPAAYQAWADLADRVKLPLLVTELGVDANWRTRPSESPGYCLREMRLTQELLLYARPRGTMQWEFTRDYSIVRVEKADDGSARLTPTDRFFIVKHFCNLTPPAASALATRSDHDKALLTAFRGDGGGRSDYTFHVSNNGPPRKAVLTGLPKELEGKKLRAVRTTRTEFYRELAPAAVAGGKVEVELAAESLLTLTTLRAGEGE